MNAKHKEGFFVNIVGNPQKSTCTKKSHQNHPQKLCEGLNDEPCDELSDKTEQAAQPCTGEFSVGDDSEVKGEFGAATV